MTSTGQEHPLDVVVTPEDARTVVALRGELDLAGAGPAADALREHLARGPVLLDLRGLVFMDSTGVRMLDDVLRDVEREGRQLRVTRELQPNVRLVLDMTGMSNVLPFEDPPDPGAPA